MENTEVFLPSKKNRYHVIPIGDLHFHAAQECCWCNPLIENESLFIHHAKDCRESIERKTGETHSEGWVLIAEYISDL
jgi:hypothetical protein